MVNETTKVSYILTFMYAPLIPFVNYLQIDAEKLMILGFLLLCDFFVGIVKAVVIQEKITYTRAVAGILSKVIILLVPIILAVMSKGIHNDIVAYVDYVISALIIAETYSIMENVYVIRTKNSPKEIDLVSFVIRGIRAFLEKLLQGFKV
jgi:phage-related holin